MVNAVSASTTSPRSAARAAYRTIVKTGANSPSAFAKRKTDCQCIVQVLESSSTYRWHHTEPRAI